MNRDKCTLYSTAGHAIEHTSVIGDVFHLSSLECDYRELNIAFDSFYNSKDAKYPWGHRSPRYVELSTSAVDNLEHELEENVYASRNTPASSKTIDEELYHMDEQVGEVDKTRQTEEHAGKAAVAEEEEEKLYVSSIDRHHGRNPTIQDSRKSLTEAKVCEEVLLSSGPCNKHLDDDGHYELEYLTLDLVNVLPTKKAQRLLEILGARQGKVMDLEMENEGLRGELRSLRSRVEEYRSPTVLSRGTTAWRRRVITLALLVALLLGLACVSSMLVQRAVCSLDQASEYNTTGVEVVDEPLGGLRQWLCASATVAEHEEKDKAVAEQEEKEVQAFMSQWTHAEKDSVAILTKLRLDSRHALGSATGIAGVLGSLYFLGLWPSSVQTPV